MCLREELVEEGIRDPRVVDEGGLACLLGCLAFFFVWRRWRGGPCRARAVAISASVSWMVVHACVTDGDADELAVSQVSLEGA